MKKFVLAILAATSFCFGAENLAKLIADIGNIAKGTFVDDILYFEEANASENRVVSRFLIKVRDKDDTENIEFIESMKADLNLCNTVLDDIRQSNQKKLCSNGLLERAQEVNLIYVYEYRFESGGKPFVTQVIARDCNTTQKQTLPQN